MTGTSCDGIDLSLIAIEDQTWEILWTDHSPYPKNLKARVFAFQKPHTLQPIEEWLKLHRDLGSWYGKTLLAAIQSKRKPDVIANHGQTVAHFPPHLPNTLGSSLQLGNASQIASVTGLTVVHQFREGDLAAGGQGAPLVPLFHQSLGPALGNPKKGISIHNLGGISNLTYLGPKSQPLLAFDTGPANSWIDAAVTAVTQGKMKWDREGKLAAQGTPDSVGLKQLLKHPFFQLPPPKSTGRDAFPPELFFSQTRAEGVHLIRTATEVTLISIVEAYRRWILDAGHPLNQVWICGGGAKNRWLMEELQRRLPQLQIAPFPKDWMDPQMIEATAFAVFGYYSLLGLPLGGSWTGVSLPGGPPGHLIPGRNWPTVLRKIATNIRPSRSRDLSADLVWRGHTKQQRVRAP